jgi:hypothetical protein
MAIESDRVDQRGLIEFHRTFGIENRQARRASSAPSHVESKGTRHGEQRRMRFCCYAATIATIIINTIFFASAFMLTTRLGLLV